jgi:hypothetical protein
VIERLGRYCPSEPNPRRYNITMALVRVCDLHDLTEEVDLCAEHDAALDQVLAAGAW